MQLFYVLAVGNAAPPIREPLCPINQCPFNAMACFGKSANECNFLHKHPTLIQTMSSDGHVCVDIGDTEYHFDSCGMAVCEFDHRVGYAYFICEAGGFNPGRRRQEIPRQDEEEGTAEQEGIAEEEGIIVPGGISSDSAASCSFLQRLFGNCPAPKPTGPGFQCRLGRIIPLAGKCNGDEIRTWGCKRSNVIVGPTWQCRGGKLIPESSKCDGIRDCDDGSDEDAAFLGGCASPIGGGVVNPGASFRCRSTRGPQFVRGWQRCNGRCECNDCSDESRQYAGCRAGRRRLAK